MRKAWKIIGVLLLIIVVFLGWKIAGPATSFPDKKKYLHIATGSTYNDVLVQLRKENITNDLFFFNIIAKQLKYPAKVKAGRYEIKKGENIISILRKLRNGTQAPVNLVITKLRTKEDFAGLVGRKFESDSTAFINFLNNNDSLRHFGLDSNTVMTAVLPNTYTYYWNITPRKIFTKLYDASRAFWTDERKQLAAAKNLSPEQVYTLASIVEEETNKDDEKGNIASVYLNRMSTGMKLGADPTVKFALKDFGLRRIYNKHLSAESPYNTYRVKGLPPGPICTPGIASIDAVLHAPETSYMYFVAKNDFSGYHVFATTYTDHLKYAKEYQQALNQRMEAKKVKDSLSSSITE